MAGKGTVGQLLVEMRADLGQLKLDVKEMENTFKTSFSNIQSQAAVFGKSLASGLAAGLSLGAVVQFSRSIVELAGHLTDLSAQTGISAQTLSGIKSVLEENGTSVDALANGMFRLQKELQTITSATDPVAQAMKALGLSYQDLQKLSPEQLLQKITDAMGKQDDVARRNAIGFLSLGKSSRDLIPGLQAIAGHLDELRAKGMKEEDIKRLDEFGDALTRLGNVAQIVASGPLAALVRAFDNLVGATEAGKLRSNMIEINNEIEKLESTLRQRQKNRQDILGFLVPSNDAELQARIDHLKQVLSILGGELGKLNAPKAAGPQNLPPLLTPKTADAAEKLAEQIEKENDKLEEQLIELLHGKEAADDWALSQKEMQEAAKGLTGEIVQQQDRRRALTAQLREEKEALEALQAIAKAWIPTIDAMTDAEQKFSDLDIDLAQYDSLGRALTEIQQKYAKLITQAQEWGEATNKSAEDIERVTRRLLINQAIEQVRARVAAAGDEFDPDAEGRARAEKLGESFGDAITGGIRNTLTGIETGQQSLGEGLKNMVRNIGLELQFLALDETLLKPLKAFAKGFVTGLFGSISDEFEKQSQDWGQEIGEMLHNFLTDIMSSASGGGGLSDLFGGIGSGISSVASSIGSFFAFDQGGPIPSFATGGLFVGHGGEYVMQRSAVEGVGAQTMQYINDTGKLPGGGANVIINGDIIPRQPNMTKAEVVQIMVDDAYNRGPHHQMTRQQSRG